MKRAHAAFVLLTLAALLAQQAAAQPRKGGRLPGDCICLDVYAPVCGADDVTYSNSCQAGCAGVAVVSNGACGSNGGTARKLRTLRSCICTMVYKPVCGADQNTYGNACEAGCAKVAVVSQGACDGSGGLARKMLQTGVATILPEACFCPAVYMPVCGSDGKTYGNACEASCANVTVVGNDACPLPPPSCICTEEYAPVCGSDGTTYSNKCFAECAKVTYTVGECQPRSPPPDVGCFCPLFYAPVCGVDGVTYGNSCQAGCAKVAVLKQGECAPPIVCQPTDPGARCLADPCALPSPCKGRKGLSCQSNYCGQPITYLGQTLSEPCTAVYVDIATQTIVKCDAPASPPKDPCASIPKTCAPVCGADSVTYHNKAAAACRNVAVVHPGACPLCPTTTPACPTASSPVCCSNGVTYCNACTAKALKKAIVYRGLCNPPRCLPGGAVCLLSNPKCCKGLSCSGGPVLREGQVLGTCVDGIGPIG